MFKLYLVILLVPAILVGSFVVGIFTAPHPFVAATNGILIGLGSYFVFSSLVRA